MEQLIYTDANRIDQGVLSNATLDLEYGGDESDQTNTFEVSIDRNSKIRLEDKALVYIEGTEYGGKITGIGTNTGEDVITYKGMIGTDCSTPMFLGQTADKTTWSLMEKLIPLSAVSLRG